MVIIRVDNSSACACINTDRYLSRTMRRDLKIFVREKESAGFEVFAEHVRTEKNLVADKISRRRFGEAESSITDEPQIEWEEGKGLMVQSEKELFNGKQGTTGKKRKTGTAHR